MNKLAICVPFLFTGAAMILMPNMTRRGLLFAVPVSDGFRDSSEGRKAIAFFRTMVGVALLAGVAALLTLPPEWSVGLALIGLVTVTALAFYKSNRLVAPFRLTDSGPLSVAMSIEPDQPPNVLWYTIGPFLILMAVALFLHSHWDSIPAKFPVHWGMDLQPDRWAYKGFKSVYGGLIFTAESCAWFSIFALASWSGARRSAMRVSILQIMIAVQYMLAAVFGFLALLPVLHMPTWSSALLAIAPLPLLIAFIMKKAAEPSDPAEKTPEECWKGAVIYFNPNDVALVVEKRTGFGYTFNFANPWAWALMAGLVLVLATMPFLLL